MAHPRPYAAPVFAELGHFPRFLDQRRRRGDTDQLIRPALGFGPVQVVVDAHIFDGCVVDDDIVATSRSTAARIAQTEAEYALRALQILVLVS